MSAYCGSLCERGSTALGDPAPRLVHVFMHELGPLVATALLGCVASYCLGKAVERRSSREVWADYQKFWADHQNAWADDRIIWAMKLEESQRDLLEVKEQFQLWIDRSDRLDEEDAE